MLKALELVGFKSFADKTRFEFPPGITVIVGPNGSGKSNVVDAIKWVFGEQSAKSLRGKDMADVIFKGTQGAPGRKPAGSASATILLENVARRLPLDADEVSITRRVYRSGESEYLINGEQCRLKDIRDLIRGTGVGADAYSLIEQGKVERLLQASNKDRRAIFEEAAGISRFNAKKIEAQRRLARVEQNLLRLHDIVDEVGSRYRSLKSQAAKASRYRDYTRRLQELRTHVGRSDWRQFSQSLLAQTTRLEQCRHEAEQHQTAVALLESEVQVAEERGSAAATRLSELQGESATCREAIANCESRHAMNQVRLRELADRNDTLRHRLQLLAEQQREVRERILAAERDWQAGQAENEQIQHELRRVEADGQQHQESLAAERRRLQELRRIDDGLRASRHELEGQANALRAERAAGQDAEQALTADITQRQAILQQIDAELAAIRTEQGRWTASAEAIDQTLRTAREELAVWQAQKSAHADALQQLVTQQTGLTHRAEVIEEVEQRFEGVHQGAKELLAKAQTDPIPPWNEVQGLVADLVQVNVEHAPLIDIALGELAQYLVLHGDSLLRGLTDGTLKIHGRAGLIADHAWPATTGHQLSLAGIEGVIGRADQFVQCQPAHEPLVRRLLGNTWIVKQLPHALHLRNQTGAEVRFITLEGDVVDVDGTIIIGARLQPLGIVSRRSELRAARREIHRLGELRLTVEQSLQQALAEIDQREDIVQRLLSEHTETAKHLARAEQQAEVLRRQRLDVADVLQHMETRWHQVTRRNGELEVSLREHHEQVARLDADLQSHTQQIQGSEQRLNEAERLLAESQAQATTLKVQLAKIEQRVHLHQQMWQQDSRQLQQLTDNTREQRGQLAGSLWSGRRARREIAEASEELVQQQTIQAELAEQIRAAEAERGELERVRDEHRRRWQERQNQQRSAVERGHAAELQIEKLHLEREQLAVRLREDYGIDLAQLDTQDETPQAQAERAEIDAEIADLRQKLGSIGTVNMDALDELDAVEARFQALDSQYQDLVNSKEVLEKIIQRINQESRRLFLETLAAIRENFQTLFRQTFGGGRADILLEEGVDVLDAGVEIVATPPGKPEFNNSLLSGGEKALTAVSLLMAIFKFRPSPFCVLDEVDAPFDEANIGRFIDVLKSFLGWTKFIIVTHSKKTMTAATTLYGVTMQESGISKRVSVRFEDVGEDGEIHSAAPSADDAAPGGDPHRGVA